MQPLLKRLFRLAFLSAGPGLLCAWLAGFVFRDRIHAVIWLYFIPAPAAVVASLAWLWLTRRMAPPWLRWLVAALLAIPSAKIVTSDMRWHAGREPPADALRVTHWNVARLPFGGERVLNVLRRDAPDICVLSETVPDPDTTALGASLGLTNSYHGATMTMLSRHPISPPALLQLPDARGWCIRVATPSGPLDVLAFDMISRPGLDRFPALRATASWIATRDRRVPLLVLGDFNTPRDAASLAPFRAQLAHAYETAGRGWPYTWPLPFPVYQVDHAWYSPGSLEIFEYRLRASMFSDHRRQTLSIRPRGTRS